MLTDSFLDWWHTPWTYAINGKKVSWKDNLGKMDAYLMWCDEMGIATNLPVFFDPGWSIVESIPLGQLKTIARLFGGIIAARSHAIRLSVQLSLIERKWCASIASTQPLSIAMQAGYAADDSIETMGLVELARRIEKDFPGLWSRLSLQLEAEKRARIEQILKNIAMSKVCLEESASAIIRAQRCLKICQRYVAERINVSSLNSHTDSKICDV